MPGGRCSYTRGRTNGPAAGFRIFGVTPCGTDYGTVAVMAGA